MEGSEFQRAVETVKAIAAGLALPVDDVVVINNSDRVALRLLPCDILARIVPAAREASSAFELEVARRLVEVGAPVGAPEPRAKPRVYLHDGFAVSFWTYYDPLGSEIMAAPYAGALMRYHAALREVDDLRTPNATDRVATALRELADRTETPDLLDFDRDFLIDTLGRMGAAMSSGRRQLLHGEPHPGNLLNTAGGPLFVDLETCCRGPIEFDLAHAPEIVDDYYPGTDQDLIHRCRVLNWALFTTCWRHNDQLPNRQHWRAEGLSRVRTTLDRYGLERS
jgi:hypothetical protein